VNLRSEIAALCLLLLVLSLQLFLSRPATTKRLGQSPYSSVSEAMSIEKRYFTSDFARRS
jgi:hypothetical protein